ncbi:unnamed protein product, partial [Musa textilis]
ILHSAIRLRPPLLLAFDRSLWVRFLDCCYFDCCCSGKLVCATTTVGLFNARVGDITSVVVRHRFTVNTWTLSHRYHKHVIC